MTKGMKLKVIAFIRTIASHCDVCHRPPDQCYGCIAKRAKGLLGEIAMDEDPAPQVDYSFYARVKQIIHILTEAGRPLLAKEIDLKHTCSPQLKCWTLNQMVFRGTLGRKFAFKSRSQRKKKVFFFYYLKDNKETK